MLFSYATKTKQRLLLTPTIQEEEEEI